MHPLARALYLGLAGYAGGAVIGVFAGLLVAWNSADGPQDAFIAAAFGTGPLGALGAVVWSLRRQPGTVVMPPPAGAEHAAAFGRIPPRVLAIGAGAVVGLVLAELERWVLWPPLIGHGVLNLEQPAHRLAFILIGAIPAVVCGIVTGRMTPRSPTRDAAIAGTILLAPVLLSLPVMLRAYATVAQSPLPLILTVLLRPGGAWIGGVLAARRRYAAAS
jgi:hypothetical protein